MTRRAAFTVIELLVVISIITVLLSLLQPALQKNRKMARQAVCLSSLRQMAVGVDTYAVDSYDFMPPYDNANGLRYETFWMTVFDKYHNDDRIRNCPETHEDPTVWGTAAISWGPAPGSFIGDHTGSYGWNSWMHSGTTSGATAGYFMRRDATTKPSHTPYFADASWVDFWPQNTNAWPASILMGSQPYESSMGRVAVDRHDFAVNVAMVDTSARLVRLPDLWSTLNWHPNYVELEAPPGP